VMGPTDNLFLRNTNSSIWAIIVHGHTYQLLTPYWHTLYALATGTTRFGLDISYPSVRILLIIYSNIYIWIRFDVP
jgi:hypothetical protein